MALIDGIGDDVISIFIIIFTIIIIILSWLSTHVRDFPFPANLLVIERRSRRLYTTNTSNGNINLIQSQQQSVNTSTLNSDATNHTSSTNTIENLHSANLISQSNVIRSNNLELVNEMVEQALVENLLDGNFYTGHSLNLLTSSNTFSQNSNGAAIGVNSGNGQVSSSMHSTELNQNQASSSETEPDTQLNDNDQSISIFIKFVNEREMKIQAKPSDTILLLKKAHFSKELSNNKIVRFIYQGQFLADKNTIKSYNIKDQTTIHCHITSKAPSNNQTANQDEQETNELRQRLLNESNSTNQQSSSTQPESTNEEIENPQQAFASIISNHLLLPLLAVLLGTCWYFRINFKHLFSPLSTLILIIFTFLYAIFLFNNLQSSSSVAVNNILVHRRVLHIREEPQQHLIN